MRSAFGGVDQNAFAGSTGAGASMSIVAEMTMTPIWSHRDGL
jgi:hypothetical protein